MGCSLRSDVGRVACTTPRAASFFYSSLILRQGSSIVLKVQCSVAFSLTFQNRCFRVVLQPWPPRPRKDSCFFAGRVAAKLAASCPAAHAASLSPFRVHNRAPAFPAGSRL